MTQIHEKREGEKTKMRAPKKILPFIAILTIALSMFSISALLVKGQETPAGTTEPSSPIEIKDQVIEWTEEGVIGSYDYYVPFNISGFDSYAYGSFVRIVGRQNSTTVTVDGVGSFVLDAGDMAEFNLTAGTHIRSDLPVTVVMYDDFQDDWEMLYLPPVEDWGKDYWYAGLRAFHHPTLHIPQPGTHYLFITAAFNGTRVDVDVDNDGLPEQSYDLDEGEVAKYGVASVVVGNIDSYNVSDDPREGAHITANNTIQVHAWATHEHYFGSGYVLLPTAALGRNHCVPFVQCTMPSPSWDDADRIKIVGTVNGTEVKIDEDNDGIAELTQTIDAGDVLVYPNVNQPTPFPNATHVTSDEPIVVLYTSPGGIEYWDGGAVQIVPEESALTEYWNTVSNCTYHYTNIHSFGDSYLLIFAFKANTTVNVDKNNDGIVDDTYTIDPGTQLHYKVYDAGYHVYSDNPIYVTQVWWYYAGGSLSNLGYARATHDVAILDVAPSTNRTYVECVKALQINVTVTNEGDVPEDCTVNLYADNNTTVIGDEVTIGTQPVVNLTVGENRTLTFFWDTTGVTPCYNYTITAEATPVPGETDIADNTLSSPTLVKAKLMGDINGDGIVDIQDLVLLTKAFGSRPNHPRYNPDADICGNGKVDIIDLVRLIKNFGKAC